MLNLAKKIFGTKNARVMKAMQPIVQRIGSLEDGLKKKSDAELQAMTFEFRRRHDRGESLDDLLPEAFAVCREAGRRVLGMRHFDVQLMGGMVLHRGGIAEMRTGEGKTLVATLPVYLNAIEGKGVHVITVNDYLARRDAEWMGRIYKALGLTTGVVVHGLSDRERQANYRADISYGTNSEFGFDYLRDNMKDSIERYVQRDLNFAIVDEVDSILIDEARTPLIISGSAEDSADLYQKVDAIIPGLRKDIDYTLDEKAHSSILTDTGIERVEQRLGVGNLYNPENIAYLHHVTQALKAHTLYKRDVNYLIEDGKVIIVDEFTGRKMPGRRWSDGLHQAVEAKEGVEVQEENQTIATISYQNYFRLYKKLGGMTGTADTEAAEFHQIYKLDVSVVPTNRPIQRKDYDDVVYKNERGKFRAVVDEIEDCHKRGQPVLVGTVSVEKSEVVASLLRKKGIPHSVLNAKQHEREAFIVAQAGRKGAVTISTNMAGRGTDIILGGNAEFMARAEVDPENAGKPGHELPPEKEAEFQAALAKFKAQCEPEKQEVLAAGGLHILGTERHESRRIDNQLRGRAGRQGDPGSSRFFLSLEDDLMRIFGAERITGLMERLGMEEDVPIEHGLINRAIENAQKKVEGHNFDIRKNLLEYDDVMNQQRKAIYALRRQVLEGRYAPEPTEEEKKKGKTAADVELPRESGKHTLESLVASVRPVLGRMCDALTQVQTPAAGADSGAPPVVSTIPLDPAALRSTIYRQFGAYPDTSGVTEDRAAALDRLADEVASSMLQQHMRLLDLSEEILQGVMDEHAPAHVHAEEWDLEALRAAIKERFNFTPTIDEKNSLDREMLIRRIWDELETVIEARETEFSLPVVLYFGRYFYLEEIDARWIEHLKTMEALREGIGLRGYGQKDPKQEYKKEGFDIFGEMITVIGRNVCEKLFHMQVRREEPARPAAAAAAPAGGNGGASPAVPQMRARPQRRTIESGGGVAASAGNGQGEGDGKAPVRRNEPKVGRNDPCPCGSGKKYKKCHGAQVTA
ncbi:MAG TPA: preprotein translocase subunit SecA [Polyangia bacterium]|jgi:preprotein translocase subunit SecA|nr:preprotein translocase subunit SecA [Polyangia bacterium]